MDAALNRTSLKLGISGLAIQIAGLVVPHLVGDSTASPAPAWANWLAGVGAAFGGVLFILGLGYYAAAKGHSRWAGLLGLLSVLGYIVLALLPDRNKPPRSGGP